MIERREFAVGLGRLAVACRQTLDDPTLQVYFEALQDQTNPPEWEEFTKESVHDGSFGFFPRMNELLEALFAWRKGERPSLPALPRAVVSADEKADQRARGLAVFRAELKRLGVPDPLEVERKVTSPKMERTGQMEPFE